jgi:uncharacterized protein YndB with AHSA1/START domain
MTSPELADAAFVPDGDAWTLIFVRDLRHPPEAVWQALTDPAEIDRWAPFAASRDLGSTGDATLTMVDGDRRDDLPATVRRAEAPTLLEYTWGTDLLRGELDAVDGGTRLTLRHTMTDRDTGAMAAAGWHLCVRQLDRLLNGESVQAVRGGAAMAHGWGELRAAYAAELGR